MSYINEKLKENIESTFGNYGKKWLKDLPTFIYRLERKWKISKLTPFTNLTFNYVLEGESFNYGNVVIKVCPKEGECNQEYIAIKSLNPFVLRRCYDYDEESNSLLLEYITPGETLHSLNNIKKEIEVGCKLIKEVTVSTTIDSVIPTYKELLDKAFRFIYDNSLGGASLPKYIHLAEKYFYDLSKMYEDTSICHGDFHHDNIIQDEKRGWVVIDPKGFRSFWFGDIGRFLLNQICKIPLSKRREKLDYIISEVQLNLKLPKDVIFKAVFIETILCYAWHFQCKLTKEELKKLEDDMINEVEVFTMEYI